MWGLIRACAASTDDRVREGCGDVVAMVFGILWQIQLRVVCANGNYLNTM